MSSTPEPAADDARPPDPIRAALDAGNDHGVDVAEALEALATLEGARVALLARIEALEEDIPGEAALTAALANVRDWAKLARDRLAADQRAAQDADAEAPDAPPPDDEPPPGVGLSSAALDVDAPPAPDDAPAPGTVEVPERPEHVDDDAYLLILRDAGCICANPLAGPFARNDSCPLRNHGIPF
jgi:hypothetical protein